MGKAISLTDTFRQLTFFKVLSERELQELEKISRLRSVSRYKYIFYPGEQTDKLYILTEGTIKTGRQSNDDREVIKSVLHPLSIFGELGLVGVESRSEFAMAMSHTVSFIEIDVLGFKELMRKNHELSLNVLNLVGGRLQRTERKLESLIFKDARTRIIDFLKEMANLRGRRVGYEMLFNHCLTQQEIANITGTSRQTVTSVLNELRKENLINFNRRSILIRDITKLA